MKKKRTFCNPIPNTDSSVLRFMESLKKHKFLHEYLDKNGRCKIIYKRSENNS